ncbi:MAG: sterol desaturase family protein [Henriciella sp.]
MQDYIQIFVSEASDKVNLIIIAFAAMTVLSWLKSGREAFQWDEGLRQSGIVNLCLLVFNLAALIIPVLAAGALVKLLRDVPHIPAETWDDVPLLVKALAAFFIYDVTFYAFHATSHANKWLWPLHAVHHSDTRMHFLSSTRAHILEWVLSIPLLAVSAYLCGLSINGIAFLVILREAHQFYVHSSLDWSHGPLRHVIASPRFHRWHHIDREDAHNKNFALFFPFIDLAFGTYHVPGPSKDMKTGFEGNPGDDFGRLIVYPFLEWARLIRRS